MWFKSEAHLRHVYDDFLIQKIHVVILGFGKIMKLRSITFVKTIATISWSFTDSSDSSSNY